MINWNPCRSAEDIRSHIVPCLVFQYCPVWKDYLISSHFENLMGKEKWKGWEKGKREKGKREKGKGKERGKERGKKGEEK